MFTEGIAQSIIDAATFAKVAHIENPRKPSDRLRFHDQKTPYIVHPIWCAMTILTETNLEENIRFKGYLALMWHDILEDTKLSLPNATDEVVAALVRDMTFSSFNDELELLWRKPPVIRLLKLYDKTSNLLDGSHMSDGKWNRYTDFTELLIADVQSNYGDLNIIKIAKSIAVSRL